ncbi:MAG: VWA domain-containing protein [Actinobacteria bacterium]|nr:MAG: VWA domain-containing protein [Actinomycetota bacterium]
MAGSAVVSHIVTFGRVLREAGLEVGPGRVADAVKGLDAVELARQDDVYWTLRQTLVSRREDIEAFDRAFDAWFLRAPLKRPGATKEAPPKRGERRKGATPGPGSEIDGGETSLGAWSHEELLRTKDFASMTPEEFARAKKLIQAIAVARPQRRTRRLRPDSKGRALDVRGLVRASLATGGDPVHRAFRSRSEAPRKLVLILDVSGSMEAYARAMLLYLHAARGSGRGVEAFAFGTRLTRLTHELGSRDPETALAAAAKRVMDWSGGTRIGESLKAYNDEYGRRALTRGAVVVVLSDGCERGDPGLVAEEMARLRRQAFAVVWVNPLKGDPAYQPLAGGMRAALPHVDRFLAGHDVASLEALGTVLGGIERRHAA